MFNKKTEVISFNDFMRKENTDFFAQPHKKEMIENKIRGLSIKVYATVLPSILVATPAWAETIPQMPPDIDTGFHKVELICVGISGGVAVLCLMADGILKMLGIQYREKWMKKIYMGLVQVITAPLAVAIVVAIIHWIEKIFSFQ